MHSDRYVKGDKYLCFKKGDKYSFFIKADAENVLLKLIYLQSRVDTTQKDHIYHTK